MVFLMKRSADVFVLAREAVATTRPCHRVPSEQGLLAAFPPTNGENRSGCQSRRGQWAFSATGDAQRKAAHWLVPSLRARSSFWLRELFSPLPLSLSLSLCFDRSLTPPNSRAPSPQFPPLPSQMPALAALGAVHSAYVVLLRSLISLAIFLSVACSADRVFKVAVHLKHKLREMLTGKRPEHDFSCRPLPDPASYALVFPKVS